MAIFGLIICFGCSAPFLGWINEFNVAAIKAAAIMSKACTPTNEISPIYNPWPNTSFQHMAPALLIAKL